MDYRLQVTDARYDGPPVVSQVLICGAKKTSVPSPIPIETKSYLLPPFVNRLHSFCLSAVIYTTVGGPTTMFFPEKPPRGNVRL